MSLEPSRASFETLVPWARREYAQGRSSTEVLRGVYGVDLPAEAYALWRALDTRSLELPVDLMHHPWELIAVADPAHSDDAGAWERAQEQLAFARFPRFLPLMKLVADEPIHDDNIIGYDLDDLEAGRTSIFGHLGDFTESKNSLVRLGDSLLSVLHEWMSDHHRTLDAQRRSPSNRGFGSISQEDVAKVARKIQAIEALQRTVRGTTR